MFQFPPLATHTYGFSVRQFGYPGINARLTAPPGFSQSSTPFIAFWRLDIPHTPLVACPHCSFPPARANPQGASRFLKARNAACYGPEAFAPGLVTIQNLKARAVQKLSAPTASAMSASRSWMQLLPSPNCQRSKPTSRSRLLSEPTASPHRTNSPMIGRLIRVFSS